MNTEFSIDQNIYIVQEPNIQSGVWSTDHSSLQPEWFWPHQTN
jgi:hypothetical protein